MNLKKARDRAHILEGLAVALGNIDPIIALIKAAQTPTEAKGALLSQVWQAGSVAAMLQKVDATLSRPDWLDPGCGLSDSGYQLSAEQAQAILELRLHRLTGLEQEKIHSEYSQLVDDILQLLEVLQNPDRLMAVITQELEDIRERYGDERRTKIIEGEIDLSMESLIPEEELVVTISHEDYVKSQPIADYSAQKRGGRGKIATRTKEEDFVSQMFVANSHDTILCFSNKGKVYWLRTFQLPQAGRQARGKPLINLLPLQAGESVTAILPVKGYTEGKNLVMATAQGVVKKCQLSDFSRPRNSGIWAIRLDESDHLIGVALTDGTEDILLVSDAGKAVRFSEKGVRVTGRTSRGVRGIKLEADQNVIALMTLPSASSKGDVDFSQIAILTSTENGYGKRTLVSAFSTKGRGGKGLIAIKISSRNGAVVSAHIVKESDEVMLITDGGILIRMPVADISLQGRSAQGVKLISLKQDENLVSVGKVVEIEKSDTVQNTDSNIH